MGLEGGIAYIVAAEHGKDMSNGFDWWRIGCFKQLNLIADVIKWEELSSEIEGADGFVEERMDLSFLLAGPIVFLHLIITKILHFRISTSILF